MLETARPTASQPSDSTTMKYTFRQGSPALAEFRRVVAETLDGAISAARDASPADRRQLDAAVHEFRKSCKRLRALLRLFRPGLGKTYGRENAAARDAARLLSHFRDAFVLDQTCQRLVEEADSDAEAITSVRAAIAGAFAEHAAETIHEALLKASGRLAAVNERVGGWKVTRPKRSAAKGAAIVYGDGRRALAACRADGSADAWHDLRKHAKHYGYHCRLFMPIHPAAPAYYEPFEDLGQALGEEHDLSVLIERARQVSVSDAARRAAIRAADLRRVALRESASDLAAQVYRCRPRRTEALVRAFYDA